MCTTVYGFIADEIRLLVEFAEWWSNNKGTSGFPSYLSSGNFEEHFLAWLDARFPGGR